MCTTKRRHYDNGMAWHKRIVVCYNLHFFPVFLAVSRNIQYKYGICLVCDGEAEHRIGYIPQQHSIRGTMVCGSVSQPAIERQRYGVKLSERPKLLFSEPPNSYKFVEETITMTTTMASMTITQRA